VAFTTILAVVAGVVLAGSGAAAHDVYGTVMRRDTAGALTGIGCGLVAAIGLIILSPQVWLGPANAAPFPLGNPAIVSVPIGFLGCLLGTLLGGRAADAQASFDEVRVRSATGLGSEV